MIYPRGATVPQVCMRNATAESKQSQTPQEVLKPFQIPATPGVCRAQSELFERNPRHAELLALPLLALGFPLVQALNGSHPLALGLQLELLLLGERDAALLFAAPKPSLKSRLRRIIRMRSLFPQGS